MQTMKSIYISTSVSLFCVYHSILYTLFCIYYYIMQLYYKFEKSIALNYRLQCGICIKYLLYLKNNIVGWFLLYILKKFYYIWNSYFCKYYFYIIFYESFRDSALIIQDISCNWLFKMSPLFLMIRENITGDLVRIRRSMYYDKQKIFLIFWDFVTFIFF